MLFLLLLAASSLTPERSTTRLTEGVYQIRHADPLLGWVNGNTTVIVGTKAVMVIDSCNVAWEAKEDIVQIRKWTDKPVRYLVNTHWHHDHVAGNRDYAAAFPGLSIIAQRETKAMLDATAPHVANDILKSARQHEERMQKATSERAKQELARIPAVIEDARTWLYEPPNLIFDESLTIDLGSRLVEIHHLGRGNTAGDTIAYLPAEKILVAGDLVVHPVPYTFGGYPVEWVRTLDKLIAFNAEVIVPGHGEVLRDKEYIRELREMMKRLVDQVDAQIRANGEATVDDVKKAIDIAPFRAEIIGDNKAEAPFFDYAISTFIERAYHEAKQR